MPTDVTMVEQPDTIAVAVPFTCRIVPSNESVATGVGQIISAVAQSDGIHILVTFANPVMSDESLLCIDAWTITALTPGAREIFVHDVVPDGDPAATVMLLVDEMLDGGDYDIAPPQLTEA